MEIKLSTLAIILGSLLALVNFYGVANPVGLAGRLRKFPRSLPCGVVLMLLGTGWFVWYLSQESISDFAAYKTALLIGFSALGIASCIFVQDYLAVRGLAVVLLLLGKLMVDTARWVETDWRLVIIIWAYFLVFAGLWFTVYPWHLRDAINWSTANEKRTRMTSVLRALFGIFVAALGFTVFRNA